MFWAFRTVSLLPKVDAKLAELGPLTQSSLNEVPLELFTTNAPIHSIGPKKTHVFAHFGPFRYCTKIDAKLAELAPLTPKIAK
jgi:hypothetical protein